MAKYGKRAQEKVKIAMHEMKEGKLKGIDLKTKEGVKYYTVYLVKDNKDFLKAYQRTKNTPHATEDREPIKK